MKKNQIVLSIFVLVLVVGGLFLRVSGEGPPLKEKKSSLFSVPIIIPLPSTCLGQASAVKIADFNQDGFNDILVVISSSNPAGCQLLLYYQNSSVPGTFSLPAIYDFPSQSPSASAVDVADLNNDSFSEVVLGLGNDICIFQNQFGVLIPGEPIYAGSEISSLKIGYLTSDILPDIVVSSKNDDCLGIFTNQGNLQFLAVGLPALHSSASDQLAIADRNNDGRNDIILLRGQSALNTVAIYYQNSQSIFDSPVYLNLGSVANVLVVGSLDSMPGIDIAVTSEPGNGSGILALWSSNNSVLASSTDISPNTVAMVATDFDQNGLDEIIAAHKDLNLISTLWCNNSLVLGSSAFCYTNISNISPHNALVAGDLNHDGSPDLAVADSFMGLVIMFNSNLTGLENKTSEKLLVYPNPFKEQLVIKTKNQDAFTLVNIYNALGQKVFSSQLDKTKTIATDSWSPGFYSVELILATGKREAIKILKTP